MKSPARVQWPVDLGHGYELCRAHTEQELRLACDEHVDVFGEYERQAIAANLFERPGCVPEDVLYVRQRAGGAVASSVTMFMQRWFYEGLPLPVAEVGCVSTRPEHRTAGLVRQQFAAYHRRALQAGAVLSVIQGIPYFYRQFGYDYVLPLNGGVRLPAESIPEPAPGESQPCTVRPAVAGDYPTLRRFHETVMAEAHLAADLTVDLWRYQVGLPAECSDRRATYVVERGGEAVGFVRLMANEGGEFGNGALIVGAYVPDREAALAALQMARGLALEARETHTVRVDIHADTPLTRLARELGGQDHHAYGWQVRVLDTPRLMRLLAPALERHLAESTWAGLTRDLVINLYHEIVVLGFVEGKLRSVRTVPPGQKSDLSCPPTVAPMIWLGARSVAQVTGWYADATARDDETGALLDAIFPLRQSAVSSLF
jgi:predicted N-acetyltransferase YhbS